MLFLRPCLVWDWLEAALVSVCIQCYIYSRVVTGTRDSQVLSFSASEETSLQAFFIFLRFSKVNNSLRDGQPRTNPLGETWGSESPSER